ncbi:hypothetical protein DPMN_127250 [Dreissena polymorpha]|uniref:Uncharacterized protein n=1 Tax=Dreissena polymorpha TaxID=45954 RepID=A0A9D4H0Y3_DREPO|nr:hypothetical protein DPMN_127250 [Dreissena polymorpha]
MTDWRQLHRNGPNNASWRMTMNEKYRSSASRWGRTLRWALRVGRRRSGCGTMRSPCTATASSQTPTWDPRAGARSRILHRSFRTGRFWWVAVTRSVRTPSISGSLCATMRQANQISPIRTQLAPDVKSVLTTVTTDYATAMV